VATKTRTFDRCPVCGLKRETTYPSDIKRHEKTVAHTGGMSNAAIVPTVTELEVIPEAPARPVGLVVGGTPYSQVESDASTAAFALRRQITELENGELKRQRKEILYRTVSKYAGNYGEKAVANTQERLDRAEADYASLQTRLAAVEAVELAAKTARYEADHEADAALALYVTHFAQDMASYVHVSPRGRGTFEISYATGKVRTGTDRETGEPFEYPETDSVATVYGPGRGYGKSFDERVITPAYLAWTSNRFQGENAALAPIYVDILQIAVQIRDLVNALYGIEGGAK
jgi:hypothetical protein